MSPPTTLAVEYNVVGDVVVVVVVSSEQCKTQYGFGEHRHHTSD
jgi:hypothetical protein